MNKKRLPRKPLNSFFRYSNLAIQMGLVIGLFSWGGLKIDAYFNNSQPYFTIILSLTGIGGSLYLVIKDVLSNAKNEEENES